jgi:hypothetical protein
MTIQAGHDHSWAEDMDEVRACCPGFNPGLAGTGIRCPGETEREEGLAARAESVAAALRRAGQQAEVIRAVTDPSAAPEIVISVEDAELLLSLIEREG